MIEPVKEYRFYPERRWRIDYAWPDIKLAVELEGGVFIYGRHTRPTGFVKDMEKYNMLTQCGWRLLRYQPKKIDIEQILMVYNFLMEKNNGKG
jgi:very-short-patch-repair endonuclease